MADFKLNTDRTIDSTDTNEFATGIRDESLLAQELVEEVPLDDMIPDDVDEERVAERPIYNEAGVSDDTL